MPSGVDWREPLKTEGVEAGLPRELGMLMAAVLRAKLGEGDGMRGRDSCSWNSDMVVAVVVVVYQSMEGGQRDFMAQKRHNRRERNWRAGATANKSRMDQQPAGVLEKDAAHCGIVDGSDGRSGYDGFGGQARCAQEGSTAVQGDAAGQLARCSRERACVRACVRLLSMQMQMQPVNAACSWGDRGAGWRGYSEQFVQFVGVSKQARGVESCGVRVKWEWRGSRDFEF
jgi:hypothetical protein